MDRISFADFAKVDIRVGKVVAVEEFPEARNPSYRLTIDFGSAIGVKKSSAQLCGNYSREALQGKLVLAVVNFPPKQIGSFMSEVLTLGVPGEKGVVLVQPEKDVKRGGRLY